MVEILITDEMLIKARRKAIDLGQLNNSIERGDGNLVGFLGELVAQKVLGGRVKNTYEYDLVLKDGTKIDVKTKKTSVAPKDYYDCSIANYNTKQECDEYCFVRVKNTLDKAWVLGRIGKEEYFKKARFLKKGEQDGDNGYFVKSDCHNLQISELNEL
jgi:hypothetical protein